MSCTSCCEVFSVSSYCSKSEVEPVLEKQNTFLRFHFLQTDKNGAPRFNYREDRSAGQVMSEELLYKKREGKDPSQNTHLEEMEDKDYEALKGSNCMPTLLPGCSFFLDIPYGPAKQMMQKGLPIALASDYNPGSSPSGNMNFVASLGCTQLKMTPEEVINATTINTAYAMGIEKELGSICVGKKANLFITKSVPSYAHLPYSFGKNVIEKVMIDGKFQ